MSPDAAAILCLIALASATVGAVVIQARRSADCWQTWALHVIARCYSPLMFRQRLGPRCTLPSEGGALLIGNHRSPVDPLLIFSGSCRRRDGYRLRVIEFLTASEYCRIGGFIGWVCKHTHSIPVDRDGRDREPAKEALRRLQRGHLVGIFPEGRINTGAGLLPANPGVAWLALKGGQPVIPVFIHGAPQSGNMVKPFVTSSRVRVTWGDPIDLSEHRNERFTPELLNRVTSLLMERLAATGALWDAGETEPTILQSPAIRLSTESMSA
ncbi:MAG: 1-acyl-sn-glycerol-3-phosphate acyltransferase [Planctomyces sp.]|nr:1-acyl-sn-glycerol-3-phosphate acyltransferase [Planctomyces sp.]